MGTAKRERQKANRAKREQELARAAAKSRTTRIAVIIVAAIVGVFALVFVAGQLVDDDDEPTTPDPVIDSVDPGVIDSVSPGSVPVASVGATTPDTTPETTPGTTVGVTATSVGS